MAGLQTSVGLISGIDIQGVVQQLIDIEAVPRDNLQTRQDRLIAQQTALVKLTDLFNTTTYMIRNLGKIDVFTRRVPKSSNESVLKVTRTSNPQPGNYQFTPLQLAQSQTTLSDGVASDKTALGKEGEITIKFGRDLETNYSLSDINGGYGFDRGYIRITDGTGARANIDLRTAQTMSDILEAINTCIDIDIAAEMEGDHIKLTDYSGGSGSIIVQEVNNGTTAASLGLLGSSVINANGVLQGNNLLYLGADMDLNMLNDGHGIAINSLLEDLMITVASGKEIEIDFSELIAASGDTLQEQTYTVTVGDLLDVFNKAAAEAGTETSGPLFTAQFRSDGKGFEIIDHTTGSGKLTIAQHQYNPVVHNPILYQLGFAEYGVSSVTFEGTTATGRAVLGDMDSVLLSSLNGGRGFNMETVFDNVDADGNAIFAAKDRAGNFSYVTISRAEFATCETLADMTRLMNYKLENAVLYVADSNPPERIPKLVGDPPEKIIKTYGNGNIKYELGLTDRLNFEYHTLLREVEVDASGDPTVGEWVYDPDETSRVIGYKNDTYEYFFEFEKLDIDDESDPNYGKPDYTKIKTIYARNESDALIYNISEAIQESFTNGNLPVLDADGKLVYKTVAVVGLDPDATSITLEDDATFVKYNYDETEVNGETIYTITGYSALDKDGDPFEVNFEQEELDFIFENGLGRYKMEDFGGEVGIIPVGVDENGHQLWFHPTGEKAEPVLENGKIKTETHVSHVNHDIDYVHSEGYRFDVEWQYDTEDTTKVVGYKFIPYDTVRKDTQTTFHEMVQELYDEYDVSDITTLKMPYYAEGNWEQLKPAQTVGGDYVYTNEDGTPRFLKADGVTPLTVAEFTLETVGVEWLEATDTDGNTYISGYKLGDGLTRLFTQAELKNIADSPDEVTGLRYPNVILTEAYEYETGVFLEFQVNADMTGLEIVDTSGSYNGTITFGDLPDYGGHISAMLGFGTGVSANATKIIGGDLYMQAISKNTKIADLNGGSGVNLTGAVLSIVSSTTGLNSAGQTVGSRTFQLEGVTTIGELIDAINRQGSDFNVLARINAAGDGIIIEDNAGGTGTFSVTLASGDKNVLKLLGIKEGNATNTFDTAGNLTGNASLSGSTKYSIEIEKEDSLDDIRLKINELGLGVQATVINDGTGKPYRLSIASTSSGAAGTFKTDLSALGLGTSVMSKAQDAVLLYGDPNSSTSLLVNSKTNTFSEIVPGISMTINTTSTEPISVWTENSPDDIKASLNAFVTNYNAFREFYNEITLVNITEGTKGLLAMDSTILRLGSDMSELLLQIFNPNGPVRCLQDLGISITPVTQTEDGDVIDQYSGKIAFDESTFDLLFESNPDAIQDFFARQQDTLNDKGEVVKTYVGYAKKWENLYYSYSYYEDSSTLNAKFNSMQTQIEKNEDRLLYLQERLDFKQEYLLNKFYAMEAALASMQGDMDAIGKIGTDSTSTS